MLIKRINAMAGYNTNLEELLKFSEISETLRRTNVIAVNGFIAASREKGRKKNSIENAYPTRDAKAISRHAAANRVETR
jgi:hypothetical protein